MVTLQLKAECPYGRQPLSEATLIPNRMVGAHLAVLPVRCIHAAALRNDNSGDGDDDDESACAWRGQLSGLRQHLGSECEAVTVACANAAAGCAATFARRDTAAHAALCVHERVACAVGGCGARVQRNALDAHMRAAAEAHVALLQASLAVAQRDAAAQRALLARCGCGALGASGSTATAAASATSQDWLLRFGSLSLSGASVAPSLAAQQPLLAAPQPPLAPGNGGDGDAEGAALVQRVLGETLFPLVEALQPELAGKITGMLLELEDGEILQLLRSASARRAKVDEAVCLLRAAAAETQETQA
jgi:hypothetical protein